MTTQELVYVTANTYTCDDILRMEGVLLRQLQFSLSPSTAVERCSECLWKVPVQGTVSKCAEYLMDLSLISYECLVFRASTVALSAFFLARLTVGTADPWPRALETLTSYAREDLLPCARILLDEFSRAPTETTQSVYDHYDSPLRLRVAQLTPPMREQLEH